MGHTFASSAHVNPLDDPKKSPSDNSALHPQTSILEAALRLRHDGFAATADSEGSVLWLFDIPSLAFRSHLHEPEDLRRVCEANGLQVVESGKFSSPQLRHIQRGSLTGAQLASGVSRTPVALKSASNLSALDDESQAATIYSASIAAIKSSLLNLLANGNHWVWFGADTCVRVPRSLGSSTTSDDLLLQDYNNEAQQLSIDVRWSLSGLLTASSLLISLPGFSRLSDIVEDHESSGSGVIPVGRPVILSPFGSRYEFSSLEDPRSESSKAGRPLQKSTVALLARLGLQIPSILSWTRLRVPIRHSGTWGSSEAQGLSEIWWPTHLCFVILPKSHASSTKVLEGIADGTFVDPLVKAEQWLLGRSTREAAIEAQKKVDEDRKLQETQRPASVIDPLACNQTDRHPDSRTDQYLSAQEASGIYPTPPDGITSLTQNSSAYQDPIRMCADEYEASKVGLSDASLLETDLPVSPFGNMDTDMFDANGLTEADFNFFDEPDSKDGDAGLDDGQSAPHEPQQSQPIEINDALRPDFGNLSNLEAKAEYDTDDAVYGTLHSRIHPLKMGGTMQEGVQPRGSIDHATEVVPATSPESQDDSVRQTAGGQFSPPAGIEAKKEVDDIDGTAKSSSFDLVTLRSGLYDLNEKYRDSGRYAAKSPGTIDTSRPGEIQSTDKRELPKIGPLRSSTEDSSEESEDMMSIDQRPADLDGGNTTIPQTLKKRKREPSFTTNDVATPAVPRNLLIAPQVDDTGALPNLERDIASFHSTRNILSLLEDQMIGTKYTFFGMDQNFIEVAQVVANQKVLQNGPLEISYNGRTQWDDLYPPNTSISSADMMEGIISDSFPSALNCTLKAFSELEACPPASDPSKTEAAMKDVERRRQATTQSRDEKSRTDPVRKMQAPYLSVRRGEDAMDMASPALYFWEELGLAPIQQGKDILAFCIYPEHDSIRDAASTFLATMENSYQSCRLGRHQCASGLPIHDDGLVPVPTSSAQPDAVFASLAEACARLGLDIAHMEASEVSYVIYMVNPFNDEAALAYLSALFLRLCYAHDYAVKDSETASTKHLVLQIVPISFLADCDFLTIPPPKAYTKLAFEVYSRCGLTTFISNSAIRLAKPIPKTINFRLTPQPPDNLLSTDSCIHLAYSWNIDQQWFGCAWTDNLGSLQWNAVYCLQEPDPDYWAAFSETVKEVLATTKEMLQPSNQPWKLYVVKDGELHQRELEVWRLHSTSAFQRHVIITMLSSKSNPPLSFPRNNASTNLPYLSTTLDTSPPATTPLDQAHTPDHPSPMATHTPNRHVHTSPSTSTFPDPDPTARLIDVVAETWSMISPIPILDPYLPTIPPLAPVLVSGYLLKRAGSEDEDGLIPLDVNLIATDLARNEAAEQREKIKMLRSVLGMFDDLAALARLRGTEEWREGVLPWHLASARKGRRSVEGCMRWGKRGRGGDKGGA
ncbi:MAG: hypothetical protein Q9170_007916 [Blastenia crenularia]